MRKSFLFYGFEKMEKQNQWADIYNSKGYFKVNQYDYNNCGGYLDALREQWKNYADLFGEFEEYVDVRDYNDFDLYTKDINIYTEKKTWKEKYDIAEESEVKPYDFDTQYDYLIALRQFWKEEYDFLMDIIV